jgi:hypothetical protein
VPSRREGPADPLGKQALFSVPRVQAAGARGAVPAGTGAATVSVPDGTQAIPLGAGPDQRHQSASADDPVARRGTVRVQCQRCGQASTPGLFDLLKYQLPVGIWLPRGRFDRRMTCPACHTRSWCSVTLRRS